MYSIMLPPSCCSKAPFEFWGRLTAFACPLDSFYFTTPNCNPSMTNPVEAVKSNAGLTFQPLHISQTLHIFSHCSPFASGCGGFPEGRFPMTASAFLRFLLSVFPFVFPPLLFLSLLSLVPSVCKGTENENFFVLHCTIPDFMVSFLYR